MFSWSKSRSAFLVGVCDGDTGVGLVNREDWGVVALFGLANCLKKPCWTFVFRPASSSDCSETGSSVRFRFWLDTTALPGAGGGGVDDLVLAVLLRFGVAFSPSVLVRLAAPLVVFSEDCMLSSATALRFREIAMCMKCVEAVIKGKMR